MDRGIPPLNAGDHLSRAEFERRYEAMPHVKKAELVEGVVYMPSPVYVQHGKPHAIVIGWLLAYAAATPGIELLDNTSLRIDSRSEVQPDAMLLLSEAQGGKCQAAGDGFMQGSPSSSPRLQPVVFPTICTASCGCISATACKSTWCY